MQLTFVFALMILQAVGAIRIDPNQQSPKKEQFVAPFVTMPQPPAVPRVDFNACPFEGCQFGKWTARKPVTVYSSWTARRKIIARVRAGEKLKAITGVSVVVQPGKVIFDRDVPTYGARRGDVAYTYMYCGEGATDMWTNGRFVSCADASFSWKGVEGCQRDCDGHYLEPTKSEWWVRVRLKDGRTGWVKVTDNFDGTDALA